VTTGVLFVVFIKISFLSVPHPRPLSFQKEKGKGKPHPRPLSYICAIWQWKIRCKKKFFDIIVKFVDTFPFGGLSEGVAEARSPERDQ
jgi:hypothetical protein